MPHVICYPSDCPTGAAQRDAATQLRMPIHLQGETGTGKELIFDEVAEIPLASQTSLLRFLDSMEVRPVGGKACRTVDVQIIAATNRDLTEMVANRQFRADLLYRLNSYTLKIPPLRQRQDFAEIVKRLVEEIRTAYASSGRNISETARMLGLSRTTVYKHLV